MSEGRKITFINHRGKKCNFASSEIAQSSLTGEEITDEKSLPEIYGKAEDENIKIQTIRRIF